MAETTAAKPAHDHDFEEHHGMGRYILVWAALLVGTALTYWTSLHDMGTWNIVIALIIACTKSALVVLFFMHLSEQKGANRIIFVMSVAFLLLLMGGTVFGDIATRNKWANPPSGQRDSTPPLRYTTLDQQKLNEEVAKEHGQHEKAGEHESGEHH